MRDINVIFYLCLIFFRNDKNYDLRDSGHKFVMRSSIFVTITLILE